MAWFTTDDGRRVNTEWFDKEDQQKYEQIAKNQEEANARNESKNSATDKFSFRDGDTPKSLDKNGVYKITKESLLAGRSSDLGELSGADAAGVLKGFKYEEMVPGSGMWFKPGAAYGYDVKRIK